jgi:hypothetical protein
MTARVYYGPPRDLAAVPLRDFDDVVGVVTGLDVALSATTPFNEYYGPAEAGEPWPDPIVGELWQRVAELGVDLELIDGRWLVEVDRDNCSGCAGVYGCPPGSHEMLVRELTWRASA